jgi:hypothetical protein
MAKDLETEPADLVTLQRALQELTLRAQTVCQTGDDRATDCVAARHAVDEMQAIVSELNRAEQNRTFFERHCAEHPDALDCRIYDL